MAGCVYAMVIPQWRKIRRIRRRRIGSALIKIGHVISPENLKSRRASLSWQYGVEFVGLYSVETQSYLEAEGLLHERFASRRIPVDNQRGGESREFFDLETEQAISALKQVRNARVIKPAVSWAISGRVGQRFHPKKWKDVEEQEGIEEWKDSIVIYVYGGYSGRGDELYDDDVWFGQDIPHLRHQEGWTETFEPVATVTLSDGWDFIPDEPDSDFPFWGIVGSDGDPWNANQVLHNEVGEGVTVTYIGRGSRPSPRD